LPYAKRAQLPGSIKLLDDRIKTFTIAR